jgi:uncharacterized protein DUF1064
MSRWTQDDVDRVRAQQQARARGETALSIRANEKVPKYRNHPITVNGERFDSKREAQLWAELILRQKAGEIHDLQRQVAFPLNAPVRLSGLDASLCSFVQVAELIADFVWTDRDGIRHVADCKGGKATITQVAQLKFRWLALQDGISVEII